MVSFVRYKYERNAAVYTQQTGIYIKQKMKKIHGNWVMNRSALHQLSSFLLQIYSYLIQIHNFWYIDGIHLHRVISQFLPKNNVCSIYNLMKRSSIIFRMKYSCSLQNTRAGTQWFDGNFIDTLLVSKYSSSPSSPLHIWKKEKLMIIGRENLRNK